MTIIEIHIKEDSTSPVVGDIVRDLNELISSYGLGYSDIVQEQGLDTDDCDINFCKVVKRGDK